jgi:hypothetical protein
LTTDEANTPASGPIDDGDGVVGGQRPGETVLGFIALSSVAAKLAAGGAWETGKLTASFHNQLCACQFGRLVRPAIMLQRHIACNRDLARPWLNVCIPNQT